MTEELQARQETAATAAEANPGENGGSGTEQPFKVFATREEYQAHFDKILGQRLKGARKNAEKLEKLETLLREKYGAVPTDGTAELPLPEAGQAAAMLEQELSALEGQDRELYSGLNAEALTADRKFLTLLSQGLTVKEAYHALHPEEVSRVLAERAGRQIIGNIMARGSRPKENAVAPGAAGTITPNVAAMNNDEIDALLDRVRRGENISF